MSLKSENSLLNKHSILDDFEPQPQIDIDIFETLLHNNENYFLSWFGPTKSMEFLTKSTNRESFLENLFQVFQRSESSDEFETFIPSATTIGQEIVSFFIEAFIFISNEEISAASEVIFLGKWFAEYCVSQKYIDTDYLIGVKYLYRWLKLHVMVIKRKVSSKWKLKIKDENEYEMLPDKSKAIVLAAKCYFLSSLRSLDTESNQEEATKCLRLIAKYDSEMFTWHYQLGNWLRCNRKQDVDRRNNSVPGDEEMHCLWKAYDCCIDRQKRGLAISELWLDMTLAGICQCLAELVRWRSNARMESEKISLGNFSFETFAEAVSFVKEKVCAIISKEDARFPVLIRAGEIFFNILPNEYRDYDFAESLLTRAWHRWPTNSKANHKLGILFLRKNYMERSLEFLRSAVEYSPTSFPASLDLIKTLMNSPEVNLKEIEELINNAFTIEKFSSYQIAQFQVVQGCLKFMLRAHDEAIQIWLQAYKSNPSLNMVLDLNGSINRYRWPKDRINLDIVKTSLENYLGSPHKLEDSDRTVLSKLMESIGRRRHVNIPQPVSLSDTDTNWRRPSATSNSPSRDGGQSSSTSSASDASLNRPGSFVYRQRNERFSNPAYRYGENRVNRQRPPSPESWR